jgi:predicted double-glycine peptidase
MRPAVLLLAAIAAWLGSWSPALAEDIVTGTAQYRVPVASMKELRFRKTLRQQYDFSCGSAALATLLTHHYGRPADEVVLFQRMFLAGDQARIRREGFSLLDMQRLLASVGYHADGFQLPLQKLAEAKVPAIVLVSTNGYNHFVVIKGLDERRVLVGDPASGTHAIARPEFERMWTNKLLFVIHGWKGPVRFNDSADWSAAPAAPLDEGIARQGLDWLTLPKHGPGDF